MGMEVGPGAGGVPPTVRVQAAVISLPDEVYAPGTVIVI
jgi:hypothetical protein